jgi:hypothetical protein
MGGDPWAQDPICMDLLGYRQRYYEVTRLCQRTDLESWKPGKSKLRTFNCFVCVCEAHTLFNRQSLK